MGYSKLADSIFGSSIMEESEHVRLFWLLMIAAADKSGVVDCTKPALSRKFNMPLPEIESALGILEAPDPHSRSSAEEGRRLVRLEEHRDWGWRLVNHGLYRATVDDDGRREYKAKWQANDRATKKGEIPPYPELSNGRQSPQVSSESTDVISGQRGHMQRQRHPIGKAEEEECSEVPQTGASEPPALWIPAKRGKKPEPDGYLIRENGKGFEIGVPDSVVTEFAADFEVDRGAILAEFKKAMRWVKARPMRKKTFSGIPAFLANWMENQSRYQRQPTRGSNEPPAYRNLSAT